MDLNKLKSFVNDKHVAIDVQNDIVRVNLEIGNDNSWVEFEINNRDEEQTATLINTYVSKEKAKK